MRRFPIVTARARILGWLLLVVGVAIAVSILVARTILLARVEQSANQELVHEANKLGEFVQPEGREPPAFTSVRALLREHLQQNLPDEDETFFSIVNGKAVNRSRQPPARLDTDASFVRDLAQYDEPTYGDVDTDAGPARYAVLPIRIADNPARGALVAIEFTERARQDYDAIIRELIGIGIAALLLAGAVGWLVAGRVLAPVRLVRQTAEQIGESDLTTRIQVQGNDDVAALSRTFNRMLDRIEEAFRSQRAFLDDVGHELRTPITVVRGHLELMGDDPEERRETIELVTDELDRMSRLVNDLIVLAKAGRPDFLNTDLVELEDLTIEVLAKSRALGNRHWVLGNVAQRMIVADEQRLTQALMQLAANAVVHTEEGDTIEVGSAVVGDDVTLWVRDSGPGIPADEQDRIFERFARGQSAGSPLGAGLGLVIVQSIAEAHGGVAGVESTPGEGAMFTIRIPLHHTEGETSP